MPCQSRACRRSPQVSGQTRRTTARRTQRTLSQDARLCAGRPVCALMDVLAEVKLVKDCARRERKPAALACAHAHFRIEQQDVGVHEDLRRFPKSVISHAEQSSAKLGSSSCRAWAKSSKIRSSNAEAWGPSLLPFDNGGSWQLLVATSVSFRDEQCAEPWPYRPAGLENYERQLWVGGASSRPVTAVVRLRQKPRRRAVDRSGGRSGHRRGRAAQDCLRPKPPLNRRGPRSQISFRQTHRFRSHQPMRVLVRRGPVPNWAQLG